jgi:aminodeoxyfutalosine synthase
MTGIGPELLDRIASGDPLDRRDVDVLAGSSDLTTLGMAADAARRRIQGDRATFVRVLDVTLDDLLGDRAQTPVEPSGEIRIHVGGEAPDVDALVRAVAAGTSAAPGTPLTLGPLEEIAAVCGRSAWSLAAVLRVLASAGMDAVSQVALHSDVRAWLAECADAGVPVARLVRDHGGEIDRALLAEVDALGQSGVVRAFAPLPRRLDGIHPSTGYDDVRSVALARLTVGSIRHIQVDWSLYGPKLAQVALTFGADDIDAVPPVGVQDLGRRRATVEEVRRNIVAASLKPVERNARFEELA